LLEELEYLKIDARLIDEKVASVIKRVYYESMKRNLLNPIYECRCNGRLQTKRFTRLSYTGSVVELEHLKIKTRLVTPTSRPPPPTPSRSTSKSDVLDERHKQKIYQKKKEDSDRHVSAYPNGPH
jgi:hypothetical protein